MRQMLFCAAIFAFLAVGPAAAMDSWTNLPNMKKPRSEGSMVVYQDDLYIFNGFGPAIKIENSIEKLDSKTMQWSLLGNTSVMAGNAVTHNGIVLVGDDVWLIGGRVGSHPGRVSDFVWIYNIPSGKWRTGPKLPTPGAGGGAALVNNNIHWIGGLDIHARCDVGNHFVYDLGKPGAGWQNITNSAAMPNPRNHFSTVVLNKKIYTIGGQFGHDPCPGKNGQDTNLVHVYDTTSNKWSRLANLPSVQSHAEPSSFSYNGAVYVAGGQTNGNKIYKYDPASNKWSQPHTLPQALLAPFAEVINGKLIVAGGGAPTTRTPIAKVRALTLQAPANNPPQDDPPVNDPPTTDPTPSADTDIITVEAEDYDLTIGTASHQWVSASLPNASESASMITTPDVRALKHNSQGSPMLSYMLNFKQAGKYYLWIRGWGDENAAGEGKNDSLHAGLNGKLVNTADKIDGFPPGWHWSQSTRDGAPATINVPSAGLHTLDLWMREDGLAVDRILITNDANFKPTGLGPDGSEVATGNDNSPDNTDNTDNADNADNTDNTTDDTDTADAGSDGQQNPPSDNQNPAQGSSEHIVFEAEDYDSISATNSHTWVNSALANASQSDSMVTTPDNGTLRRNNIASPMLSYMAYFKRTGKHYLWIRGWGDANKSGEGKSDSIHAGLNGKLASSADKIDGFPAGKWNWTQSTRDGAVATLNVTTAGLNVGNLGMREDGLAIDKLLITSDADFVPAGSGPDGDNGGNSSHTNSAPLVNAGPDQSISLFAVATLKGSVTDDALPNNSVSVQWKKISGPGSVTFGETSLANTTASFSTKGTYILQLSANDGQLSSDDLIKFNVLDGSQNTASVNANTAWKILQTANGSEVQARHETGAVAVDGKIYVIGGRNDRPVQSWNPTTNNWTSHGKAPVDMHHFQPVVIGGEIYIVGAMKNGNYPIEQTLEDVYIYNPKTNKWRKGRSIPQNRRRGSAGAAVYNNKIYIVGGNTRGHSGPSVNWLDEYDPVKDSWKVLANAPHARDHATVAIANGKLVVAAGRRSAHPNVFGDVEGATDVYDIATNTWQTVDNIPTKRAGTMSVAFGSEVIVIGGESAGSVLAHRTVEALNTQTGKWRTLQPLHTGRHSGGAAILEHKIHVISGNATRGGGHESTQHETLALPQ